MKKPLALLVSIFLVSIILGSAFWYIETRPPGTDEGSIIWETNLPSTATEIAVADQKILLADSSQLFCLSATDSSPIWNTSYGYSGYGTKMQIYNNRVYLGTVNLMVRSFNINTGQAELNYTAPPTLINDYKRTANFLVADGKVFAYGAGTSAYIASTGQKLWSVTSLYKPAVSVTAQQLVSSNYTYVAGSSRINPNDGSIIWSFPCATNYEPILYQDKVILWNYASKYNYPQTEHAIICLNIDTGSQLWRVDTDTPIFQPNVSGDLLLFGAQDGYFYGLNLSDGSFKWKTNVDDLGIIKVYNQKIATEKNLSPSDILSPAPPLIDSNHNRLFWSIFDSNYVQSNKTNLGSFMCLNIQSGNIVWYKPIVNNTSFNWGSQQMAVLNNELFISANCLIYCLNTDTGNIQWIRHQDSYFFKLLLIDDRVYALADKHLIVYK